MQEGREGRTCAWARFMGPEQRVASSFRVSFPFPLAKWGHCLKSQKEQIFYWLRSFPEMQQVLMGTHRQARGRRTKQHDWECWGMGWGRGNQAMKQRPQTPSLLAQRSWSPCLVPLWRHLTSPPEAPLDKPWRLWEAFHAGWKWSLSLHWGIFWKSLLEGGLSKCRSSQLPSHPGEILISTPCPVCSDGERQEKRVGKGERRQFFSSNSQAALRRETDSDSLISQGLGTNRLCLYSLSFSHL